MGKGGIACYEQFLLFPQCFQNNCSRKNQGWFGKGLKVTCHIKLLDRQISSIKWHQIRFCRQKQMIKQQRVYSKIRQPVSTGRSCSTLSAKMNLWLSMEDSITLSQMTNFRLLQIDSFPATISGLMNMAESSLKGQKTLWEKEKLLTSNFSFSCSVFKRLLLQTGERLVWERDNIYLIASISTFSW